MSPSLAYRRTEIAEVLAALPVLDLKEVDWMVLESQAPEEDALEKLGPAGRKRFDGFKAHFSGPWGEGNQRPFSPRTEEIFLRSLQQIKFPPGARPSVFLSDDGFLEL
ncbi:hypothetical protein BH23VER1_BH23VER1_13490 [soil metagenome]